MTTPPIPKPPEYHFERFQPAANRNGRHGRFQKMKVGEIKIFDEPYFKLAQALRSHLKYIKNREYSIADAANGAFAIRRDK